MQGISFAIILFSSNPKSFAYIHLLEMMTYIFDLQDYQGTRLLFYFVVLLISVSLYDHVTVRWPLVFVVCSRFHSDNNDHVIDINLGDSIDIICPHYTDHTTPYEYYIVYMVSAASSRALPVFSCCINLCVCCDVLLLFFRASLWHEVFSL